jgi:hypothetical protein
VQTTDRERGKSTIYQQATISNSRTLNGDTNSSRSCEAFEPIDQRSPPDGTNIPSDAAAHQLSASDST